MMIGSQLMIHDAMGMEMGNAKEMREMASFLDAQSDNLASIYSAKAGGDIADWRAMMLKETWMFAQEAVDLGLADSVYTRSVKRELEEQAAEETEEEPEERTEEDEESNPLKPEEDDEKKASAALAQLMTAKHRMTNRGYKWSSREKAPTPPTNKNDFSALLKGW
jgi:enoyl-CoA hydratase/carnithine racemase